MLRGLYAVLQASVENALQNHGAVPLILNGNGEPRSTIGSFRRDQNHDTWACSRKQRKLLGRFIAKPVRALNQSQARELIRVLHE